VIVTIGGLTVRSQASGSANASWEFESRHRVWSPWLRIWHHHQRCPTLSVEYTIARVDTPEAWELVTAESGSARKPIVETRLTPSLLSVLSIELLVTFGLQVGRSNMLRLTALMASGYLDLLLPTSMEGSSIYRATHSMPTPVQLL
jgi:hypothetical protein